jgi:antitoxin CptB
VSVPSALPDLQTRRLRWRCRRGMKELDVLLERFARTHLASAPLAERRALEELLALPDPDLAGYLLREEVPRQAAVAQLVARIRAYVD